MSLLRALRAYVGLGPDEDYEDRYLHDLSARGDDRPDPDDDFDELEAEMNIESRRAARERTPTDLRPVEDGIDLRDSAERGGFDGHDELDDLDDDAFIERLLAEDAEPDGAGPVGFDPDGSATVVMNSSDRGGPGADGAGPFGFDDRAETQPVADDATTADDVLADGVRARPRSTNHAGRVGEERSGSNGVAVVHSLESMRAKPRTIAPESFADAKLVADEFKRDVPVLLNLQALERDLARRLIDFSSGLCYALDGSMEKVASQAFLLIPESVEVSDHDRRRIEERGYAR